MNSSPVLIEVGIGEAKTDSAPNVLVTRGLGSCLGIAVYDPLKKVGGLAHPMLPRVAEARVRNNPTRFVDSAIGLMVDELIKQGCKASRLVAKLAGGAHMFSSIPKDSAFNVGARNLGVAKEKLDAFKINVTAEDTGGNYGRTIFFDLGTGKIKIRTMFYGDKEI